MVNSQINRHFQHEAIKGSPLNLNVVSTRKDDIDCYSIEIYYLQLFTWLKGIGYQMRRTIQLLSLLVIILTFPQLVCSGTGKIGVDVKEADDVVKAETQLRDNDYDRIRHLLNRTTFGATPSLIQQVSKTGIDVYIQEQLDYRNIVDEPVEEKLQALDALSLDSKTLVRAYHDRIKTFLNTQQMSSNMPEEARIRYGLDRLTKNQKPSEIEPLTQKEQFSFLMSRIDYRAIGELQNAKIIRAVHSERQLYEVMVDFWSNHFNIDVNKAIAGPLKIVDDREVIRIHALGNFKDLIAASAHSPAMLFYLDNNQNSVRRKIGWIEKRIRNLAIGFFVGVDADAVNANGDAEGMIGGLNENYGRELLELHSLGVDGGYTQKDVIEVSRAFTGWSYSPFNGSFSFNKSNHDKGQKEVLGNTLNSGGINDGQQVLNIIALHPNTARHLAYKLCQRFVSDRPAEDLVKDVARTFVASEGDIRETLRTIFNSEAFYDPENRASKFKSPFEFVVSSLRLLNADVHVEDQEVPRNLRMTLEGLGTAGNLAAEKLGKARQKSVNWRLVEMGQPLFAYPAPTGYPENSSYWQEPGFAMQRMNFALALTNGEVTGVHVKTSIKDLEAFVPVNYEALAQEEDESLLLAATLASPTFQYR